MLVGDKAEFAIEFNLTNKIPRFFTGNVCYWILGNKCGDNSVDIYLNDFYLEIAKINSCNELRDNKYLFNLPYQIAFNNIKNSIYGGGKFAPLSQSDAQKYELFPLIDSFNERFVFCIYDGMHCKILYNVNERVSEVFVEKNKLLKIFEIVEKNLENLLSSEI